MDTQAYAALAQRLTEGAARALTGKEKETRLLLCALAAGGHVLLEDVPGTGKTALARALAQLMGLQFSRIQGTPDLLPSDVTGVSVPDMQTGAFVFRKGPVFTQCLLVDELNRATPRTQAALLECMEECQVTDGGVTYPLPRPFFVLATQNPIEIAGTFPLPEAQLDRFMMRLSLGYPTPEETARVLAQRGQAPQEALTPCVTLQELEDWQRAVYTVTLSAPVCAYMADLAEATRHMDNVRLGVSTRGVLALSRACQSWALMAGRDFVTPDDVKELAVPLWAHRLVVRSALDRAQAQRTAVEEVLARVSVPTEDA